MSGHTRGPVTVRKCACGDRWCDQYTLSTQGAVGFSLEDATLYAAAPDMLNALNALVSSFEKHRPKEYWDAARAAIAKATGQ